MVFWSFLYTDRYVHSGPIDWRLRTLFIPHRCPCFPNHISLIVILSFWKHELELTMTIPWADLFRQSWSLVKSSQSHDFVIVSDRSPFLKALDGSKTVKMAMNRPKTLKKRSCKRSGKVNGCNAERSGTPRHENVKTYTVRSWSRFKNEIITLVIGVFGHYIF